MDNFALYVIPNGFLTPFKWYRKRFKNGVWVHMIGGGWEYRQRQTEYETELLKEFHSKRIEDYRV